MGKITVAEFQLTKTVFYYFVSKKMDDHFYDHLWRKCMITLPHLYPKIEKVMRVKLEGWSSTHKFLIQLNTIKTSFNRSIYVSMKQK